MLAAIEEAMTEPTSNLEIGAFVKPDVSIVVEDFLEGRVS